MQWKIYQFSELSKEAKKKALAAHVDYLRLYFRELLTAHFEAELRRAREPQGILIFEPDLESLQELGVRVEGASVSPEGLRRLQRAGIEEMKIQLSENRLIESIKAEGVRYLRDGTEVKRGKWDFSSREGKEDDNI